MSARSSSFGRRLSTLVAAVWCVGCSSPTGEDSVIVPGVIATTGGGTISRVLMAPDTVADGVSFTVTVRTIGSGSCTRPSASLSGLGPALAEVSVWDLQRVGVPCTRDLREFPRDISLKFTGVGVATIRVRGRAQARTVTGEDSIVFAEKSVVVR
jgi:hypothetical protein